MMLFPALLSLLLGAADGIFFIFVPTSNPPDNTPQYCQIENISLCVCATTGIDDSSAFSGNEKKNGFPFTDKRVPTGNSCVADPSAMYQIDKHYAAVDFIVGFVIGSGGTVGAIRTFSLIRKRDRK